MATPNGSTNETGKKKSGYGGPRQGKYNKDRPWRETKPGDKVKTRKMGSDGTIKTKVTTRGPSAVDKSKPYNNRNNDPDYVPPTPETRRKQNADICGAPRTGRSTSGTGVCCQTAGWGTNHPGVGRCRNHGGNLPSHSAAAEKELARKAVAMFGLPVEIDPHQALMEELWRTNGHVIWLQNVIAELEDKEKLKQFTDAGVQPSVWVKMYEDERAHLIKVSETAVKCGVQERQMQLAEDQGRLMAMVLQAFIRDPEIGLTPQQMVNAPKVLRKHLAMVPSALEKATPEQETVIDV